MKHVCKETMGITLIHHIIIVSLSLKSEISFIANDNVDLYNGKIEISHFHFMTDIIASEEISLSTMG